MADNVAVTAGSGTTIAADDVSGVLYQRVKPAFGADGSATDVSSANPLPVSVRGGQGEYEAVAASATDQVIGATGGTGDYLSHVTVIPATTSPGVVTIKDNTTAVISFPGGASSVSSLVPFTIYVGAYSVNGAWKITTGTNVGCIAVGDFT